MENKDIQWMMSDGSLINIKDMHNIYIYHTLRCLKGKGKQIIPEIWYNRSKSSWITIFENEQKNRKQNK